MAPESSNDINCTERVDCPVFGRKVTVTATYAPVHADEPSLVDFSCNVRGICGIPSWDPCPLYVSYLEKRHP